MKTLIQIQDEALSRLNVSRSSERRYLKLRGSVWRWYRSEVAKIGITDTPPTFQAARTWYDVLDMAELHKSVEDEA